MIINDEWTIVTDAFNVILRRKLSKTYHLSDPDGPPHYAVYYYSTIAGALQSLLRKEVLASGIVDLQSLSDRIDRIEQDIKKAVGGIILTRSVGSPRCQGGHPSETGAVGHPLTENEDCTDYVGGTK